MDSGIPQNYTTIAIDLSAELDDLDASVPGGRIVSAQLLKGVTDRGKSVVSINIEFDDGTTMRGWTTLALLYAMSRAFTPQWEVEVLQ